jgi:hypothetical protein
VELQQARLEAVMVGWRWSVWDVERRKGAAVGADRMGDAAVQGPRRHAPESIGSLKESGRPSDTPLRLRIWEHLQTAL